VHVGLQTEEGFPHDGTIDFVNNQINPGTGSIIARGVFANPKPDNGVRLLTPGMFVRVRLPIGPAHTATLVIDRAIGSDQGIKYVYVVDEKNRVESRRVTTGPLQDDGLRVITDGVKADEWVVVGGVQQVRPHAVVQTEKVEMPLLAAPRPAPPPVSPAPIPAATPDVQPLQNPPAANQPPHRGELR
jgi:multidrug efflux system membrane fusion protein